MSFVSRSRPHTAMARCARVSHGVVLTPLGRTTLKRREFLTMLGGAAVLSDWPLAAHAQRSAPMRRIGLIMAQAADDPDMPPRLAGFMQGLAQRGWIVDENVRIDYRWGASANDPGRMHRAAAEVVALAPDIIVVNTGTIVGALALFTQTIPSCLRERSSGRRRPSREPVAARQRYRLLCRSNNTAGKPLELLKEVARTRKVAVARDPTTRRNRPRRRHPGAAPSLQMELTGQPFNLQEFECLDGLRALRQAADSPWWRLALALSRRK